jgi:hypothetical protein
MRRRTIVITLFVSVVLAAVTAGGFVVSMGGVAASSGTVFLADCLRLTPHVSGDKLAMRERECRKREAATSHVNVTADVERKAQLRAASHSIAPAPARVIGVVVDHQGPVGTNQTFHATSHWAGEVDGRWYLVYAGARANPASNQNTQSELRVYREATELNGGGPNVFIASYVPPDGESQPLTIMSATASVLTIGTSTGATLTFNVEHRAFSNE